MFIETADVFKKHLSSEDKEKIEETDDKIKLLPLQLAKALHLKLAKAQLQTPSSNFHPSFTSI